MGRRVLDPPLHRPQPRHLNVVRETEVDVADLLAERERAEGVGLGFGELAAQHRLQRPEHECVRYEVRVRDPAGPRLECFDLTVGSRYVAGLAQALEAPDPPRDLQGGLPSWP